MSTNSKLHPKTAALGWDEIKGPESLEMDPLSFQLLPLDAQGEPRRAFMSEHRDGFYVDGYDGVVSASVIAENFIAIRFLPSYGEKKSLIEKCDRIEELCNKRIANMEEQHAIEINRLNRLAQPNGDTQS